MMNVKLDRVAALIQRDLQGLLTQLVGKSNLVDDLKVLSDTNSLTLYLNDYVKYIESGRKAKAKKIPISVLSQWAKRKGISLSNSELFAVQQSIYVKGIVGKKNLTKKIEEQVELSFGKYYQSLVEPQIESQTDTLVTNSLNKKYGNNNK